MKSRAALVKKIRSAEPMSHEVADGASSPTNSGHAASAANASGPTVSRATVSRPTASHPTSSGPTASGPTASGHAADALRWASATRPGRARAAGPGEVDSAAGVLQTASLTRLVGYAASRAAIEMKKVFAGAMKPLELKVIEFSILMLVADNPEVNQKQLGLALDLSAPNMAVTLDRMVERGWVQRVRSQRDRRAQHIHLTAQGSELAHRAKAIAATMEDDALHMLTAAERALLLELLMKVAGGARADR